MKTLVLICAFHEAEPWEQPPQGVSSVICEILTERYFDIFGGLKNPLSETRPALK